MKNNSISEKKSNGKLLVTCCLIISLLQAGCANNPKREWGDDFDSEFDRFGRGGTSAPLPARPGDRTNYYSLEDIFVTIGSILLIGASLNYNKNKKD